MIGHSLAGIELDIRYAGRMLLRTPIVTAVCAMTLALGLGANAAIFVVLDRLMLSGPPGVPASDRVGRVQQGFRTSASRDLSWRTAFSFAEVQSIARSVVNARVTAYTTMHAMLGRDADASTGVVSPVLGDVFGVLGVRPAIGRFFDRSEYGPTGTTTPAVISDAFWARRFGRDRRILGQTLKINSAGFTIIGVAAPGFGGVDLEPVDVWIPVSAWAPMVPGLRLDNAFDVRFQILGRVARRGDSAAFLQSTTRALEASGGIRFAASVIRIVPLSEALSPRQAAATFPLIARLAGGAVGILLLACANAAGLLLVRAAERRREISVRFALGGSRGRIARQIWCEVGMIGALAALASVAICAWGAIGLSHALVPELGWNASIIVRSVVVVGPLTLLASFSPHCSHLSTCARDIWSLRSGMRGAKRAGEAGR